MISVIVPAYNAERTLERAINSILSNCDDNTDIEIIVIDDGSTDSTPEICERISSIERVRVFHAENQGVAAARNIGIQNSRGEYIGFVDSDDWVEPDMYKTLLQTMLTQKADLVACGIVQETELGSFPETNDGSIRIIEGQEIYSELFSADIRGYLWNKLFKRELITFDMDKAISQCEDLLFNAMYCSNVSKAIYIRKALYHYVRKGKGVEYRYSSRDLSLMDAYEKLSALYCKKVPYYAYLPEQNALSTYLHFRARIKLTKEKDESLMNQIGRGIKTHWIPVFLSKQISLHRKINYCFTFFFPILSLKIKQIMLSYRHKNGIWES